MTQNDLLFTEIHFLLLRPLAEISLRIPWASTNQGRSGIQSKSWFVTQIAGELYILSLYWHLSVLPTLVLARLGNATASLPLRGQPRRKALRSFPTGHPRQKHQPFRQHNTQFTYETLSYPP